MSVIASTWMRGGTSKCWVFERNQLAVEQRSLDNVLLRLYGSPDHHQVDGVGGGTSTTSKAVILAPSQEVGVDVDYTFAQVGIDQAAVDWGSNCGNCSAVVGPYAVRHGWVPAQGDTTSVRVRNTNTNQLIVLQVPTPGGVLDETGNEWIPGVPFPGMPVRMWFVDPAGRTTGSLFPTGNVVEELADDVGTVRVSMIDAGAPLVVIDAAAVGLRGNETPAGMEARPGLLRRLDGLRRQAAVMMGLAATPSSAARAVPKVALIAPPTTEQADLVVRMLSMGKVHPALAITGSVGLTLAARTAGTLVAELIGTSDAEALHLATPAGVVTTWTGEHDGQLAVAVTRTTRTIAEATLLLPDSELSRPTMVGMARQRHDGLAGHQEVAS